MEIRHLQTFKTIVDLDGFKKAADHLGYAQSSITSHIKSLEEEFQQPLFERLGKKMYLTQFGKQFYTYASRILDIYTEMTSISQEFAYPNGQLTIGASEALTSHPRFSHLLLAYKEKYPEVNLSITSIDYQNIPNELQQGKVDLVLVLKRNDWSQKELVQEVIKEESMVLIAPLQSSELPEKQTVLFTEKTCTYKQLFKDYLDEQEIIIDNSVDFGSIDAIKQCVASGLGMSMLPYFSVAEELAQDKFSGTVIKEKDYSISTFLAYHKDKWLTPAMTSMIDLIKEQSSEWV